MSGSFPTLGRYRLSIALPVSPTCSGGTFWLLPVLAVAGVALRVLMTVAYPHAFYFPDSRLVRASERPSNEPGPVARPWVYSLLLKPFVGPYAEYLPVAVLQHGVGLSADRGRLRVPGGGAGCRGGERHWP